MSNKPFTKPFGEYTLHQKLGVGGMATVYRAVHNKLEREVAIKVLHEHFSDDVVAVKRLEREAKIAQSLKHPHIVTIITFNRAGRSSLSGDAILSRWDPWHNFSAALVR